MKYVVVKAFADLQDGKHLYTIGEQYPREGLEVSAERIAELSTTANKAGIGLIRAVEEEIKEIPTEKPEVAKTTKKPRKTATKK